MILGQTDRQTNTQFHLLRCQHTKYAAPKNSIVMCDTPLKSKGYAKPKI